MLNFVSGGQGSGQNFSNSFAAPTSNLTSGQKAKINSKYANYFYDGYNPSEVAALLGYQTQGNQDGFQEGLSHLLGDANRLGIENFSPEYNAINDIANHYYNGGGVPSVDINANDIYKTQGQSIASGVYGGDTSSIDALDAYQPDFYSLNQPNQAGGFLHDFIKIAAPASFSLLSSAAGASSLSNLLGLGGLTGGATGLSAGGGYTGGTLSNIGSLAKNIYDAVPSLGKVGNAFAQNAIKGGVISGVSGGDPLKGALTSGLTAGAIEGLDYGLDSLSGLLGGSDVPEIVQGQATPNLESYTEPLYKAPTIVPGQPTPNLGSYNQPIYGVQNIGEPISNLSSYSSPAYRAATSITPSAAQVAAIEPAAGGDSVFSDLFNLDKKKVLGSAISGGLGYFGSNAAANDLKDSLGAQLAKLGEAQEQYAPFLETGTQANQTLLDMLQSGELLAGFNPGDLESDAGYQFQLDQGEKAVNRAMAGQGSYNSGRRLKALQEYGQGLASQTYNDAFNRYMQEQGQQFNQLYGLSGSGQNAANSLSSILGLQADVLGNIGNVDANNTVSNFNTLGSSLNNVLGEDYFGDTYNRGAQSLYNLLAGRLF